MKNYIKIKTLQENAQSFYDAIKQSSIRFEETEKECIQRTNQVDSLISLIKNVVPGLGGAVSIGKDDISITKFDD